MTALRAALKRLPSTAPSFKTSSVKQLEQKINYTFKNVQLPQQALQASKASLKSQETRNLARESLGLHRHPDGNRSLAMVGDAVLKLTLVEDWYHGDESRERMYRVLCDIGSNESLAKLGVRRGINALIKYEPAQHNSPNSPKIAIASAVEAIIGAVYLDSGMDAVMEVMRHLEMKPRIVREIAPKQSTVESTGGADGTDATLKRLREVKLAEHQRKSHAREVQLAKAGAPAKHATTNGAT